MLRFEVTSRSPIACPLGSGLAINPGHILSQLQSVAGTDSRSLSKIRAARSSLLETVNADEPYSARGWVSRLVAGEIRELGHSAPVRVSPSPTIGSRQLCRLEHLRDPSPRGPTRARRAHTQGHAPKKTVWPDLLTQSIRRFASGRRCEKPIGRGDSPRDGGGRVCLPWLRNRSPKTMLIALDITVGRVRPQAVSTPRTLLATRAWA
jgi:hypothetical protein